ncbi:MAG: N-6 DNA methylase [Acetobacteraceae bacterium]|nr:N-6 DNA methylase [Acetobacteraceae bacterium]
MESANGSGLIPQALRVLGDREAQRELRLGLDLVRRSLEALNSEDFLRRSPDPWLYFYEDFLGAYNPKLRKDAGVYYTPAGVVGLQVRLASELLETRFGKPLGFADDGVTFLDPAAGTGAYLLAAVRDGLERVREHRGVGAVGGRASLVAHQMAGFELLVGPYAVAHLRLSQVIMAEGGRLPESGLRFHLTDTLENPFRATSALALSERRLVEEHEAASRIKREGQVLVILGNPPYDRQEIENGWGHTERKGGWVRHGDPNAQEPSRKRPILEDFLEPARASGQGIHIKNLYNDYVYFWRWALWRAFEQQAGGGVVTFITASSYLAGPGFVGMREEMRRAFDEVWVLDLGGDNLGTRKTPNVFNIRTPVGILIGFRSPQPNRGQPAQVRYASVEGVTRESKLSELDAIRGFSDVSWQECRSAWQAPFLRAGQGDYFEWPLLTDLFPWQHSGVQFKRTWPIGVTRDVLLRRWRALVGARTRDQKIVLLRDTGKMLDKARNGQPALSSLLAHALPPQTVTYSFRPFDRRFALYDRRLCDRPRPELAASLSDEQVSFAACSPSLSAMDLR